MNDDTRIANLIDYWFGKLDQHGVCAPERHTLWFQSRPETDEHMREHYGSQVEAALRGELDHWSGRADGVMALVLLLDQFTRNIFRATPRAFEGDAKALCVAEEAVARGIDRTMPTIHRVFLYIPYEHSEDLVAQERGIALFDQLLGDCAGEAREEVGGYRDYSVAHRDVIARFGRFPHRNRILGRESSEAELAHLERHGGF